MKLLSFILIFITLSSLWSCQQYEYSETYSLDGYWKSDTTLQYEFEIEDTVTAYDVFFVFRHNEKYPYRNLNVFYTLDQQAQDTLEYPSIATVDGKWLGEGTVNNKEIRLGIKEKGLYFAKGKHTIKVQHGMRKDTLGGVIDVTLVLQKK